jgi:hypothetical protein
MYQTLVIHDVGCGAVDGMTTGMETQVLTVETCPNTTSLKNPT